MSTLLRFILLLLSVLLRVNGSTHHIQPPDITYVDKDGHRSDNIKLGPKSAKHQISSHNFPEFNNNNHANYYQNSNEGNNLNARYIVQSNGAPTIQTIYESSSTSPIIGYHQTSSESSNQQNNANSHQSSSTTESIHTQYIPAKEIIINSNPSYLHNQIGGAQIGVAHSVGQNFPPNNFAVIQNSGITPGYQTTVSSSGNSFESSTQSSSASSSKSSSQFNSQSTTANPIYNPDIAHGTTPYSNQHGNIDGSHQFPALLQNVNYATSSTPATTVQTFESSSETSAGHQSSSQSSSQSTQKTSIVTTGPAIDQTHSISMSVTPTPFIISVSTPQTYESHLPIPITPKIPVHQPIPIYKPNLQPDPFSVAVTHNSQPTIPPINQHVPVPPGAHIPQPQPRIHYVPSVQPAPFTPTTSVIHHGPSPQPIHHGPSSQPLIPTPSVGYHAPSSQPTVHHLPVVTEIPVTEVQEHHGIIQKTINVPQPSIKTQIYEIRRPAIQKQFYDIEERVIVRPAGSVVVEIDHPLSKTAQGREVIVPIGGHPGQDHETSDGHNNGAVYTHGISQGHNSGTIITENQGYANSDGQTTGINLHGTIQGQNNEANHGLHQFITPGGNNYQQFFNGFGYYPYPNICDQYSQKIIAGQPVTLHHPSFAYVDQQYQPSNNRITSTTTNPFSSTTSVPLNIDNDDAVVINAKHQQSSENYIDSTTQASQVTFTTTEPSIKQNSQPHQIQHKSQQLPQTNNSNMQQMPHMITVGDPDFQSPPYVEIQPNGQTANKPNTNEIQQQSAIRGDLHNTGAHTLYTMQSVMNDEYYNQQHNQQPQSNNYQQQVNFNEQFQPNQQIQNNSAPHIVYAISARHLNSNIAPQHSQLVFPQQNGVYRIQQHTPYDNSAFRQQIVQIPHQHNQRQFTPHHSAPYTIAGNHQGISHGPLAYSSSYYNQQIPNTPINVHFNPHNQGSTQYHYIKNIPNNNVPDQYKNPHLHTGPSIFPQQEYEKQAAAYTQPQNYVNGYQQQSPSQQVFYTPNPVFTQIPQNNQTPGTLGNQGQQFPQNFVQDNNKQINPKLNQGSPVKITYNESDSYPIIDIRTNINNKTGNGIFLSSTQSPTETVLYNSNNTNFNETNNQGHSVNPSNNQLRGDIQQQDSQPQSSSINGQYENNHNFNINYQPNENQNQLLDFLLTNNHDSSTGNSNYQDLPSKSHIISATPAPKYSEPAGERVHTRRIVVNQPLETVQVVQEHIPVTNYKQVTVQQPTVYKTSSVGLKRVESSVPIFIQPQHLPGFETIHYNNHQQPISYSFVHRQ